MKQADVRTRKALIIGVVGALAVYLAERLVGSGEWRHILADLGWTGFWSMISFVSVLVLGLVYVWKKGALDWD